MPRPARMASSKEIRGLRLRLRLSQTQFARLLGLSTETYRAWDSGRRAVPDSWFDKAKALAAAEDPERLWSLQDLATELRVHVRTLRDAARAGRLKVTYGNRVVFGIPIPKATIAAGRNFRAQYYRQSYSRFAPKPRRPERTPVPSDWAAQLVRVRLALGLSQQRLAERIGAAGKAVVYQWESGRRKPSRLFWSKIRRLMQKRVTRN